MAARFNYSVAKLKTAFLKKSQQTNMDPIFIQSAKLLDHLGESIEKNDLSSLERMLTHHVDSTIRTKKKYPKKTQ